MLIGLVAEEGGGEGEEERESHSKVGTLLGPTINQTQSKSTRISHALLNNIKKYQSASIGINRNQAEFSNFDIFPVSSHHS